MAKSIQVRELKLGVCYYPEHWPEAMWEDDFRRMRELNLSIVRMGEFAWSIFEPEEGTFDFGLFDRALDLADRHGLQVVLGTPTATPPAWLTSRYPEVLNVSRDGVVYRHGARRHYNYSSPRYRELAVRIAERMAEHYANHPAVVGWQIDNELNCEIDVFYSDADHRAFREWLRKKYGTLDALNQAWGTVFWSQTYTDWEQVGLTRPTVSGSPNPHQALDEKRFISASAISFAALQAEAIRRLAPKHWVTTNGVFGHLDSHRMTDELLDFISYDSYPQFSTIFPDPEGLADRGWSLNLSNVRSISPNFCVMEQQSGPGGWVDRIAMAAPRPGQARLWTYQSILHGADMLLYFRWRTATVGTEIYWHGIHDYDNRPNRRSEEVGRIGREIAAIGEAIAGTRYAAEVAIVRDYDNVWDGELDVWHGPLARTSERVWFKRLQHRHIPADVLWMREGTTLDELRKYRALIYPHPAILSDRTGRLLAEYAEAGGVVVFGARTGYKNECGHCEMRPMPGPAAPLCGVTVEDFTMITGSVAATRLRWLEDGERKAGETGDGQSSETRSEAEVGRSVGDAEAEAGCAEGASRETELLAEGFNDILRVEDPAVRTVAVYASDYYAGKPALTVRKAGKGEAWYFGAAFNEPVADRLIQLIGLRSPAEDWLELPGEVELGIRASGDTKYAFILNYGAEAARIHVKAEAADLLDGGIVKGEAVLPPYGVKVLARTE